MKNVPRWQQRACDLLLKRVHYESASLGFTEDQLVAIAQRPRYMANDTAEIQEATRLYVDTWIVPIIEAIRDGDRETAELYLR